jgi:hypothetical protein
MLNVSAHTDIVIVHSCKMLIIKVTTGFSWHTS